MPLYSVTPMFFYYYVVFFVFSGSQKSFWDSVPNPVHLRLRHVSTGSISAPPFYVSLPTGRPHALFSHFFIHFFTESTLYPLYPSYMHFPTARPPMSALFFTLSLHTVLRGVSPYLPLSSHFLCRKKVCKELPGGQPFGGRVNLSTGKSPAERFSPFGNPSFQSRPVMGPRAGFNPWSVCLA